MERLKISAERQIWSNDIALRFGIPNGETISVAKPIVFEEQDAGSLIFPALVLSHQEAQSLIDELWSAGLRPSEGSGSAGQLASVQNHLSDMRKIAFTSLNITMDK